MSDTNEASLNSKTDGAKTETIAPLFRSRDQRIAEGKTLRDRVPRQSHASWKPPRTAGLRSTS